VYGLGEEGLYALTSDGTHLGQRNHVLPCREVFARCVRPVAGDRPAARRRSARRSRRLLDTMSSNQRKISSLEMINITKRFPGVLANDQVTFDVKGGEIHALLGENGAGKSTLMRQLYGLYHPDAGEIRIDGQPVTIQSPTDAIARGIGMIHQHFMLVDELTVVENVALGMRSSRGPVLELDKVAARIKALSQAYGLHVDPNAPVWTLAVGRAPACGDHQGALSRCGPAHPRRTDRRAHATGS
jgi:ABC-type multidrug transport system fused ATPase/permease subunit